MGAGVPKGFTLIELCVTVAVAAIALTVGVPNFRNLIRDTQLAAQTNRLLAMLYLTRNTAAQRRYQVTFCKADVKSFPLVCDRLSCDSSSGAHCWERGGLLFADRDGDGELDDDRDANHCETGQDTDCLIQVFEPLPQGFSLRTGNHTALWIGYHANGFGVGSGVGKQPNDTFRLCYGTDRQTARSIVINQMGRASVRLKTAICP